jgi:hypothetical protein
LLIELCAIPFPKMPAQVCCLTPIELRLFVTRGELPNCSNCNQAFNPDGPNTGHAHRGYREVERLVGKDDGSGRAVWIGGRFMAFIQRERRWHPRESGPRMAVGPRGTTVLQLVNA